jgi:ribosome maturation factor RimP
MTRATEEIEKVIWKLGEPVADSTGLELVQVQFRREANGWVLRVFIDREEGITVDDCAAFSRELSDLLDVEDLIEAAYHLEVSSPGLDRPLVKPEDFTRFSGREITLRTREPVAGRRNFKGLLGGLDGDSVLIDVDGERHKLAVALVERANLVPAWDG